MGVKTFLNPEGHHNGIIGSKVTVILLKGWILPIGGAASGRVCNQRGYPVYFFLLNHPFNDWSLGRWQHKKILKSSLKSGINVIYSHE